MDKQDGKVHREETGIALEDMPPEDWRKAFMRRMESIESLLEEQREYKYPF